MRKLFKTGRRGSLAITQARLHFLVELVAMEANLLLIFFGCYSLISGSINFALFLFSLKNEGKIPGKYLIRLDEKK